MEPEDADVNPPADQKANDAVMAWARNEFANEVQHDLSRAKSFDGMVSQILVEALERFSVEELKVLAEVLPLKVASTGPRATARRNQLPSDQRQLVERLQEVSFKVSSERWKERSEYIHKMNSEDMIDEAKSVANRAASIIKQIASDWGFACRKVERALWRLTAQKNWGELSVQFDLGSTMEFQYFIFALDKGGQRLRWHDHYLGVLGIGPSAWRIKSADECCDQILARSEFIRWHLNEYDRILVPN